MNARNTSSHRPRGPLWGLAIGLIVLAVAPFVQTLDHGLVWDDSMLLKQVARVGESGGTSTLFKSDFRLSADRPLGYYRPVTTTSLWWQIRDAAQASDVSKAARALHFGNILIHVLCTLLVWLLLRRLTGGHWAPWLAAGLFAVHPVHVEPVVFISARTDLLAALFSLGAILCWLELRNAAGMKRLGGLVGLFVLTLAAALSKEQALMLPVVVVALAILLREAKSNWWAKDGLWIVMSLLAVVAALMMRSQAQVGFGPGQSLTGTGGVMPFIQKGLPSLVTYNRIWFFPWPLNGYYTTQSVAIGLLGVVGIVLTAALVWLAFRAQRGRQAVAACALSFFFVLPVLHFMPLNASVAAERFFYLSSFGCVWLTMLGMLALQDQKVLIRVVSFVAISGCMFLSLRGTRPWVNDATLFAHIVQVSPKSATAHRGLAESLYKSGKKREAMKEAREAIRLEPDYADAYELLGVVSAEEGEFATAREAFENVARLYPNRASAYINLGVLAVNMEDLDSALRYFNHAASLNPAEPETHLKLGTVYLMMGNMDGANYELGILDRLDRGKAQMLRQMMAQPPPTDAPPGQ